MEFQGKVCIVTGASSGIGKAIAIALAKRGCSLTITGRSLMKLENTKEECKAAGLKDNQILIVQADMKLDEQVKQIVDKTIEFHKQLDFVVNNAGMASFDLVDDSMDKFREVFQVDVNSMVYLNKLAIPHLEKTKGVIVNNSSCLGMRPVPGCLAYVMSKACIDHYNRVMALELAEKGIRINNVNPGLVATEIFSNAGMPPPIVDAMNARGATWTEMLRTGKPEEVADVVCFLLSSKSSMTTGANFVIDGGMVNMLTNAGESVDILEVMKNQMRGNSTAA